MNICEDADDPYGCKALRRKRISTSGQYTDITHLWTHRTVYKDPRSFAIGDLILKAIKGERLEIKSKTAVIRSYVSATDVAKYSIEWV